MNEFLTFDTSPEPELVLTAYARLTLTGWDQPKVEVRPAAGARMADNDFQIVKEEDRLQVTTRQAALVQVPSGARVQIKAAYGEAVIQNIYGGVTVENAFGKLLLKDLGPVQITEAKGGVNAADVHSAEPPAGDALRLDQVFGSVNVANLQGGFTAQSIGGNLNLKDLNGGLAATVLGNASLDLNPQPGHTYQVTTHGNMYCRVPAGLSATIKLESYGPAIIKVGEVSRKLEAGTQELVFGAGEARLHLVAYGVLNLLDSDVRESDSPAFDFSRLSVDIGGITGLATEITQQVTEQLQAQLEMLDSQLDQALRTGNIQGLSPEKAEQLAERAHEKAERAREKIQAAAERAQEKMSRKLEEAQRKIEREVERAGREGERAQRKAAAFEWTFKHNRGGFPGVPTPPPAPRAPGAKSAAGANLEAEKMAILNMLASKKITAEEADRLLAALDA